MIYLGESPEEHQDKFTKCCTFAGYSNIFQKIFFQRFELRIMIKVIRKKLLARYRCCEVRQQSLFALFAPFHLRCYSVL